MTDEAKQKLRVLRLGNPLSDETKRKLSIALKGRTMSAETRQKMSSARLGKHCPHKGVPRSPETRRKLSERKRGKPRGMPFSDETRRRIADGKRGERNPMFGKSGPLSPTWRGGVSFRPYSLAWTKTLKRSIRERDNYTCRLCSAQQTDRAFPVHHIDFDKEHSDPSNLVTLCHSCHSKVTAKRLILNLVILS